MSMIRDRHKEDRELAEYRKIMEPPDVFEDGFNWKSVVGALFLGILMMPGSLYLQMVIRPGTSFPTQWVMIIIFAEIARRSFKELKMQEVYVLYYMAGLALAQPYSGMLWNQFFVQSDYTTAMGVAQGIPSWWAPSKDIIQRDGQTFFTRAWIAPILMLSMGIVITKLSEYGLGYFLYRITSDVEQLPFPMAPIGASACTALVESKDNREPWRWRCFSIGGMFGMAFGAVYVGFPAITGVILGKPIQLIPIPWVDFTSAFTNLLPATPVAVNFNLGLLFIGMVLPFWAVIGGVLGMALTMLFNPLLHSHGLLPNWSSQMGLVDTVFSNSIDFYLSFTIGITLAIAFISMGKALRPLMKFAIAPFLRLGRGKAETREFSSRELGEKQPTAWQRLIAGNEKRGDFSIFISLGIYLSVSAFWIGLSAYLIKGFPWMFFVFYALVYTPLINYASAKLEGLAGMSVAIPFVREATYILSGYKGVAIWFAPAPLPNYGPTVRSFRVLELTGTKIKSQIKAQLITIPIILIATVVFSQLLWRMGPVPSESYPYANKMWELIVKQRCLQMSSTMEGGSLFMEAWKWEYFGWGMGWGIGGYLLLSVLGLPTLLVFGMVRGLGMGDPSAFMLELTGALLGRYYFRRRFGDMWRKYTPVLSAGFACGMGLLAMLAVAFTIITKMMAPLIF